jgi:hypothetical protein
VTVVTFEENRKTEFGNGQGKIQKREVFEKEKESREDENRECIATEIRNHEWQRNHLASK